MHTDSFTSGKRQSQRTSEREMDLLNYQRVSHGHTVLHDCGTDEVRIGNMPRREKRLLPVVSSDSLGVVMLK